MSTNESPSYEHSGWPRDFDFRVEVSEQQELIKNKDRQRCLSRAENNEQEQSSALSES